MKNINKYITVNENGEEEEGHMCKALEDLFEDGRAEGEDKLGKLVAKLIFLGRTDDVSRAASDKNARAALYAEFGMSD